MDTIFNFVLEYKVFFITGLLILVILFSISASFRGNANKAVIAFFVIVALFSVYFLITGKSALNIPSDINLFFNTPMTESESSHKYYRDPEERSKNKSK